MKMASLYQPYASAIPLGLKGWETRSWETKYRGPLGIHATQSFPRWARDFASAEWALGRLPAKLPMGAVVAVVDLIDCIPTIEAALFIGPIEKLYGDYSPGRFAWRLENIRGLTQPIPCKGLQKLWTPSPELEQAILAALTPTPGAARD